MTYLVMQMLVCLLIAFLLGLLFGWLLGRRKSEDQTVQTDALEDLSSCRADLDGCRADLDGSRADLKECGNKLENALEDLSSCRADLDGCRSELDSCRSELDGSRADLKECRNELEKCLARDNAGDPAVAVPAALADLAGEDVEPDDLKVVEGVGPKIEGLLNADGISTWVKLANTEVSFLQSVLDKAGPRYRIHDPSTWPRQAALAAADSWDELEELQGRLKGGREK